MLAEVGLAALALAFGAATYAVIAALWGALRHREAFIISARNAALLVFPLTLGASLALLIALMTAQYQIAYVWQVTNPNTPDFYRFTALWGSQSGSLLFWNLLMSGFSFVALLINWNSNRRLMPWFIVYTMAVSAFFLGLSLLLENPFARIWIMPDGSVAQTVFIPAGAEGPSAVRLAATARGLNPLLRHFGMIIHPPLLYLGFVSFVIPFAFAMSALASGDLSTNWIKAARRWALIAWLFLSLGLLLGGRWAYDVLGWGGYWGWDPVENAAFIPWLIGTAFLHSVMIQEKRGMLKVWNMFLIIFTFSAVIFGTFATRSGLIDSVHSFAQSSIGGAMFLFWAAVTLVSVGLTLWRWNRGELRSEHGFAGLASRETLFVLNNVVFVALALAIFWGSFGAPILSELVFNTDISLGASYFTQVTAPLFAAMYILMGIAPLSAWGAGSAKRLGRAMVVPFGLTLIALLLIGIAGTRGGGALFAYGIVMLSGFVALYEIGRSGAARARATGENIVQATIALFGRNRRRYGGFIVHLGITVIGLGVIGSTLFQAETQQTLRPGEALQFQDYSMTFQGIDAGQIAEDGRFMDIANLTLARNGAQVASLRPRHDIYPSTEGQQGMTMIIPGSYSTLENDFYVLFVAGQADGSATFKVYINPLINLIWWGGLILIVGTLISAWPAESAPASVRERRRAKPTAAGVVA
ncbi:MAG: heme lyase CcmF/NrfE family subunit [Anaerolineae bacterium]|nr:heme lyase CcmF/NrfE family subunit [Anaerolineae bacterium]